MGFVPEQMRLPNGDVTKMVQKLHSSPVGPLGIVGKGPTGVIAQGKAAQSDQRAGCS